MVRKYSILALILITGCASSPGPRATTDRVRSTPDMDQFLEQYATTYRFRLGQPGSIKIAPDGKSVLFLRTDNRSFVGNLYELDVASGEERVLLTAEQILQGAEEHLTDEEKARRERMRSTVRGIASYALSKDGKRILVPLSGRLFIVDRATAKVKELISESGYPVDPVLSPDGKHVACVRDGDLFVIDIDSGKETKLTTHEDEHISHGLAEFVAQEEMSRYHGFWWSPDSKQLLYQTNDTSKLEVMHIMDPKEPANPPQSWPYPRPGKANVEVTLHVVSRDAKTRQTIEWDIQAHPYLNTVRWQKNAPLTIVVQNRPQTEQKILEVDPGTGATKVLHTETDPAWLNIDQSVPRWLSDGSGFLWTTERNGALQLELRDANGQGPRALTPPELGMLGFVELDEESGHIVVRASAKQSEEHLYEIPLSGAEPRALTSEPGLHSAVWGKKSDLWVHGRSLLDGTRDHRLRRSDGTVVATVKAVTEAPVFEPNLELLEIKGTDRTYSAAIVRPRDFDPNAKYPVFVSVYGGPGFRVVAATPYAFLLSQWFADHGFVVVSIDGRGTPGKGREWERAIKNDFIKVPLADQADGLAALGRKFPELDLSRVGVFGWSFGGYFTCMAVMQRPDVYQAGVSGAPVTDWLDYDTHYTERYMDLPEANPEGYDASSVLTYADRLERPLLIMHGTADDNVYFSHAIKLTDALFRAGKKHDFLPLSGFTHMVPDPLVTTRLYTTIIEYFMDNLPPAN